MDVRQAVVLLVEDDEGDQELTRRALEEDVFRVELRVVSDGEEAIDYLEQRGRFHNAIESPRPDLVLLDLNLPGIDGRGVLKYMRGSETLRRIPVVVLTTSKREVDVLKTYDLGCSSFITKPVDVESFVSVIRLLEKYWFELVTLPRH